MGATRNVTSCKSDTLYSCSQAQLDRTLDGIVADIDSDVLEPERRFYQRLKEQIEERKQRTEKSPAQNDSAEHKAGSQ
jgi:hypothetical protein